MNTLEDLSINNTRIKNISPLAGLSNIKIFKCYNTSIKRSKVDEFTEQHPGAEVVYY
jgi:Leucine-rich repeat (LRR) protein